MTYMLSPAIAGMEVEAITIVAIHIDASAPISKNCRQATDY